MWTRLASAIFIRIWNGEALAIGWIFRASKPAPPAATGFGLQAEPQWFLADLPDGGLNPWDAVYAQVADQMFS
jgi:hypothetical protein